MIQTDHQFTLAADIADQNDYTALVLLHSYREHAPRDVSKFEQDQPKPVRRHVILHVERWRHIGYPEQVRRIVERFEEVRGHVAGLNLRNPRLELVVDATGLGRPILDSLREANLRPRGIVITGGGDAASKRDGITTVPKQTLATTLQVVLQSQRLRLADDVSLDEVLYRELHGFRVKVTLSGHARFGNDVGAWREAEHDDLVLAVALGVWAAEHRNIADLRQLRAASGLA